MFQPGVRQPSSAAGHRAPHRAPHPGQGPRVSASRRLGATLLMLASVLLMLASVLLVLAPVPPWVEASPLAAPPAIAIPAQARTYVSDAELVDLVYSVAQMQVARWRNRVPALQDRLAAIAAQAAPLLGPDVSVPEITVDTRVFDQKLAAVRASKTVDEALNQVAGLQDAAVQVSASLADLPARLAPMMAALERRGATAQQEVTARLQPEIAAEEARIRADLEARGRAREQEVRSQIEQDTRAYAEELVRSAGPTPDRDALEQQVRGYAEQRAREAQAGIERDLNDEAARLQAAARKRLEASAAAMRGPDEEAIRQLRSTLATIDQTVADLARARDSAASDVFEIVRQKRAQIVERVVAKEFERAEAAIRAQTQAIAQARAEGRKLPSVDELISELSASRKRLTAQIAAATTDSQIDEAIATVKVYWDATRKDLELARSQGSREILTQLRQKLTETEARSKLNAGLDSASSGIRVLEKRRAEGRRASAAETQQLQQLRQLVPLLREGLVLVEEVNRASLTDDPQRLLDLRDRVKAKFEAIERTARGISLVPAVTPGIFIEAENESDTRLLRRTESWHSAKEVNPSWRPSPSGSGDWYLSRGGEALIYGFEAPVAGTYTLWIRDLNDGRHPRGARSVTSSVDGRSMGTFAETGTLGVFTWHSAGTVTLTRGNHRLEVVKAQSTSAAAILDAYFFTMDTDEPDWESVASSGGAIPAGAGAAVRILAPLAFSAGPSWQASEDDTLAAVQAMLAGGIVPPSEIWASALDGIALPDLSLELPWDTGGPLSGSFGWDLGAPVPMAAIPDISIEAMIPQITLPADIPSGPPSGIPTGPPDGIPTGPPSGIPTGPPSGIPSGPPAGVPSGAPAGIPSGPPSGVPSGPPSGIPTGPPSGIPTGPPSGIPSGPPVGIPSVPSFPVG